MPRIYIDKLDSEPPHTLSRADIHAVFAAVPSEWLRYLGDVRLSAEMPDRTAFGRPVIYSAHSRRLNVCDRGLAKEVIIREIVTELAVNGIPLRLSMVHRLTEAQVAQLRPIVDPIVKQILASQTTVALERNYIMDEVFDEDISCEGDFAAIAEGLRQSLAGAGTPSDEFFKQFEAWFAQIDPSASASDLRASAAMRLRVFDLISEEKKGPLSPAEKAELDGYMKVEHIMRMVKATNS